MFRLMRNKSMVLVAGLMLVLPLGYTNCSAQMNFEAADSLTAAGTLNSSGAIVINNGAPFTKSQNVTLQIAHLNATQMYITNDPTCETGGEWEPMTATKMWSVGDRNRDTSVYVKFSIDGGGAASSACLSDSIVHDDIAPGLNLTAPAPAYTNSSSLTVGYAANDSGSGVDRVVCVSSDTSETSTVNCGLSQMTASPLPEGSNVYTLIARDRAGNESPSQQTTVTVDRTVPTIAINLAPPAIASVTRAEFRLSAVDDRSGIDRIECRLGNPASVAAQPFAACSEITVQQAAAGANRFEARSVDRAGNISAVVAHNWSVDVSAPSVTITSMPGAYSNQVRANFEFTGIDDGVPLTRFECSVDSGAAASCSSPYTSAALAAGPHQFSVVGIDAAGNRSAPASYNWIIDTEKPLLTFGDQAPAPVSNSKRGSFTLVATDNVGIDRIECQIDTAGFSPCSLAPVFDNLADGARRFQARAIDRAGNISDTLTHTWAIDTSRPTLTITSGPARWVKVRAATFVLEGVDLNVATGLPALRLECKLDGGNFQTCTSPASYSGLNPGNHSFIARAVDAAGNISTEAAMDWGIDLDAPIVNFGKQPISLLYVGEPADLAFIASDAFSGLSSVMCGINGALAACSAEATRSFTDLVAGEHTFLVVALDRAGNETRNSVTWKVTSRMAQEQQLIDVRRSNKLDVLVVIDNSGSMATEQANMAQRFSSFIDQLNGLNWQLGIVTTDVSADQNLRDGRLVEFRDSSGANKAQYMIASTMNITTAKNWFGATIQRAVNEGSGNEQGIAATQRAIQRAGLSGTVNARNAALFRSDAALAVLVVTDADETNPAGTQPINLPENLLSRVRTTWPSKPFSFHSVIVPIGDSACRGINGNEGYGYAYDSLSLLTGGLRGTVCASDYGVQLQDIGKSTQDLIKSVTLNCNPIDTTGDGKPDVAVTTADGSPAPAYTVEGRRVLFASPLPVGQNRLVYHCPAQ